MNAHNEQHDSASPVVKQNLTTQPAAAQEAVCWQRKYIGATRGNRPVEWHTITKDEFEATKAGKWADRYEVRALYAAPVTAAPGIDLTGLRARVVLAIRRITSGAAPMRVPADMTDPDLVLGDVLTLLDTIAPQIDASPKGALPALPDDFSQSKDWQAGGYAERVEWLMDTVRSQREHIDDLLDSPKGGSEARDAALNTLAIMFHNSEEIEGPDGMAVSIDLALWHEALEAYEVLIGDYDEVTLATSAQAQAGDAEVQP